MFFSSEFIVNAIDALREEIAHQKILSENISSDYWPADYDPNDIVILKSMLSLFENHRGTGIEIAETESKPVKMALEVINRHLQRKK